MLKPAAHFDFTLAFLSTGGRRQPEPDWGMLCPSQEREQACAGSLYAFMRHIAYTNSLDTFVKGCHNVWQAIAGWQA